MRNNDSLQELLEESGILEISPVKLTRLTGNGTSTAITSLTKRFAKKLLKHTRTETLHYLHSRSIPLILNNYEKEWKNCKMGVDTKRGKVQCKVKAKRMMIRKLKLLKSQCSHTNDQIKCEQQLDAMISSAEKSLEKDMLLVKKYSK